MLAEGWSRQRRQVRRLNRCLYRFGNRESRLRQSLRSRLLALLTRVESLMLIAATGALWTFRLRSDYDGERSRPLIELASASLLASRWKRLISSHSQGTEK
jgi:hypothetical protein